MLRSLFNKFESGRAALQRRLEESLPSGTAQSVSSSSVDWRKRGNELLNSGMLGEAAECYRSGIEADPCNSIFYSNLGYVLGELGRYTESEQMLVKAIALNPDDFDAHYLLGNLARTRGEWPEAIASYRKALEINPEFDVCRRDMCVSLAQVGQTREARIALEQGPAFAENTADFYYFRGNLNLAENEFEDAITNFLRAAELQPNDASILINLGVAQLKRREVFAAIRTYEHILSFQPDNVQAHANMAAALQQSGQIELAIQSYRHALQLNPEYLNAHQNLLYALTCAPGFSPANYLEEARRYGHRASSRATTYCDWSFSGAARDWSNCDSPIRVGFVSGDLRTHPVGMFLETTLANIDSGKFTLVAYSNCTVEDAMTERLKPLFAQWHTVAAMPDKTLARKIYEDRIDILVDLAGHTGLNRLSVFAWKPAPVQVAWLGFWASTGVTEIDYLLADPISVPPSESAFFSEKLWYLPDTRFCFSSPVTAEPIEVGDLPAESRGYVTFGSFQILNKISNATLAAWAQILAQLPAARLRIQSLPLAYPDAVSDMKKRLAASGIGIDRVDLFGGAPRDEYLASYRHVDLVLDTFPFPGGTTTVEALWMGVPTVTLAGNSLVARQGQSMMHCVGLDDWVAASEQEFVRIAVAHASDVGALGELRRCLRSRVLASPLFNASEFAQNLQNAFEGMLRARATGA